MVKPELSDKPCWRCWVSRSLLGRLSASQAVLSNPHRKWALLWVATPRCTCFLKDDLCTQRHPGYFPHTACNTLALLVVLWVTPPLPGA